MISARPVGDTGKLRLLLPDDKFVYIDPGTPHDEIVAQHDLDRLVEAPEVRVCNATYLDGPLRGDTNPYAPTELGGRISVSTLTPSGREVLTFELVALPTDSEPGKLRLV